MYQIYLGKLLLPVTPEKISVQINSQNETIQLVDGTEINILKNAGLTDIEFDFILPNSDHPFAQYKSGFKNAKYFLDEIEKLKTSKKSFVFLIARYFSNGEKIGIDTRMDVAIEDYTIEDDTENGTDFLVSIKLKQYISKPTLKLKIKKKTTKKTTKPARTTKTTKNTYYVVRKGDCLYMIAKKYYGDGNKYKKILNANKDKIKSALNLTIGTKLLIPK